MTNKAPEFPDTSNFALFLQISLAAMDFSELLMRIDYDVSFRLSEHQDKLARDHYWHIDRPPL